MVLNVGTRPEATKVLPVYLELNKQPPIEAIYRSQDQYGKMKKAANPYGDGKTALRIAQAIREWSV